jgi:hypothetical protein
LRAQVGLVITPSWSGPWVLPRVIARCDRLIGLSDGAVIDDIETADGYPVDETIRRVGQLG